MAFGHDLHDDSSNPEEGGKKIFPPAADLPSLTSRSVVLETALQLTDNPTPSAGLASDCPFPSPPRPSVLNTSPGKP